MATGSISGKNWMLRFWLDTRLEEFELNNETFVKYNSYWAKCVQPKESFPYDIF